MATIITKEKFSVTTSQISPSDSDSATNIAPLGAPLEEKRFWFQRRKGKYDPNAIATQVRWTPFWATPRFCTELTYYPKQPSVFDDPETAEKYQPRDDW